MMHGSMGDRHGSKSKIRVHDSMRATGSHRGRDRVGPSGSSFFLIVEKEFRSGYERVWGPAALELYCK
jgi:hypothetical protein